MVGYFRSLVVCDFVTDGVLVCILGSKKQQTKKRVVLVLVRLLFPMIALMTPMTPILDGLIPSTR
jgi:hypothetical protein